MELDCPHGETVVMSAKSVGTAIFGPFSGQKTEARKVFIGIFHAFAVVAACAFPMLASAALASERVFVTLDRAKIVRFTEPATAVIVGNPVIANASVYDDSMLIITGKSYGTTNLIILDANGHEISETLVTVRSADDTLLTIHKGTARLSYDCAPSCQPFLGLGDDPDRYDAVSTQVDGRIGISESNAER